MQLHGNIGRLARAHIVGFWLFLLTACGYPVQGAEVLRRWIIEDAHWLIHLDMDVLKTTDFYRYLVEHGQAKTIFNLSIQSGGQEFKMDFTRCESMTFYGNMGEDEDSWVGLLKLPPPYRQEILTSLEKLSLVDQSPLDKIEENPAWNGFNYDDEIYIYSPTRDLFILGEEDAAEQACGIITGKVSNKAGAIMQDWERKPGNFLAMGFVGKGDGESPLPEGMDFNLTLPESLMAANPLLQKSLESVGFDTIQKGMMFMGETTNRFWMNVMLRTTNAASATQLRQTLANFAALAQTVTATNRQWNSLLRQLKITSSHETVQLTLDHATKLDGKSIYEGWITLPTNANNAVLAPANPAGPNISTNTPAAPASQKKAPLKEGAR